MAKSAGPFILTRVVFVPNGVYQGTWGGYRVTMKLGEDNVEFNTDDGVSGLDVPVTVTIQNGVATVEPIK
jgi:hypothetical protein